jgi:hypothetical protein
MIAKDSAKFWLPKLEATWLVRDIPKTVFVNYDEDLLASALFGQRNAEYDRLYYAVEAAIMWETGEPVFIRTDLTSAKHAGVSAYKVTSEDDLNHALLTTLSYAQLKSYHTKVKSSAIMVRQFINVKHERTAFGGLPIAKEWRIFADQDGVQCTHKYWPKEALEGHMDDGGAPPSNWPDGWAMGWIDTSILDGARAAAKAQGAGAWSVDYTQDVNDKWWLVDMATAANSYHATPCKFVEEKA